MIKGMTSMSLAALLACAGCAAHKAPTAADATPAGSASATPRAAPSEPAVPARPVTGTGTENRDASPSTVAPPSAAASTPSATNEAKVGEAPPATAAAAAAVPTTAPKPSALGTTPAAPPKSEPKTAVPVGPPGELQLFVVVSAAEIASGEVVTVDVMASSSTAVVDAPVHLSFGPNVLEFVDAVPGDFLTQGGSSVVFLADGRSRPGDVAIGVGRVSREEGASGSGLLCRVRLRGVGAGTTPVSVGQAKAWGTSGEEVTVRSVAASVVVR
jgi:hypothetical protein